MKKCRCYLNIFDSTVNLTVSTAGKEPKWNKHKVNFRHVSVHKSILVHTWSGVCSSLSPVLVGSLWLDIMMLIFDNQTPAWSLVCSVCDKGKLCVLCFDEPLQSSRKSSLPVEGGNFNDCDLWVVFFSSTVLHFISMQSTRPFSAPFVWTRKPEHTQSHSEAKPQTHTVYFLTGSLVVIMVRVLHAWVCVLCCGWLERTDIQTLCLCLCLGD